MAKAFALTMGNLAMAVTLLRGAKEGAGVESTIITAVVAMIALASVGAVVGAIAQQTVDDSVRQQLEKELGS